MIGQFHILGNKPGHSTIDGKIEREGEAYDGIDDDDNVLGNIIIKETQTKTFINGIPFYQHEYV